MSAQAISSATHTALAEDYPRSNFKHKEPVYGPWLAEDYRGKLRTFDYLHAAIRWIWSRGGHGKVFAAGADPYKGRVFAHIDKGRAIAQFATPYDGTDLAPW
jgi:hypothetical protein